MKKITYLVAPLMVMPFLIGCNKVTTHKVASVLTVSDSLKFTTMNGKELKGTSFNDKQDFKFKVQAAEDLTAQYTIDENSIGIYVGKNATLPLLDGYTVNISEDEKTAEVTISAEKVIDDIYIDGIAKKADNYIYCVPFMLGVQMPAGKPTLGWQPKGSALNLQFEAIDAAHTRPSEESFLFSDDGKNFHYAYEEETLNGWISDNGISITQGWFDGVTYLTVAASQYNHDYLLIGVRSGDKSSFLDSLSWDEIKSASELGYAKYLFNLGDEKHISFKTDGDVEVPHTVKVIGFNHDTITGTETKAGITFQFATAISDSNGDAMKMAWDGNGSSFDFEQASINKTLKNNVLPLLPEDLRNSIKTVAKKVGKYNNEEWGAADYNTQLFPLADIETSTNPRYDGDPIYCVSGEGTTYAYYEGSDVHTKRLVKDVNGTAQYCWLRSPNTYDDGLANYFTSGGYLGNGASVSERTYAVAPCFCI